MEYSSGKGKYILTYSGHLDNLKLRHILAYDTYNSNTYSFSEYYDYEYDGNELHSITMFNSSGKSILHFNKQGQVIRGAFLDWMPTIDKKEDAVNYEYYENGLLKRIKGNNGVNKWIYEYYD